MGGIALHSTRLYKKGSISAAESAIAITKNALRQLCLSNPIDWPEVLPTLLQAINSTDIDGIKAIRTQLYFSPYSWQHSLKLNGLLFPEKLFLETHEQLNHLLDKRKKILKKRHISDNTNYFKGNLVFATNLPSTSKNNSGSAELNPTVEDLYYVEAVHERWLRLIGVFSGVRRTLPREMCTKLSIEHLSNLQIRLQHHQLQRLSEQTMKANQYLPPSSTRSWQYLMDKRKSNLQTDAAIPPNYVPDINSIDCDSPQFTSDEGSDTLGTLIKDVYGQVDHIPLPRVINIVAQIRVQLVVITFGTNMGCLF